MFTRTGDAVGNIEEFRRLPWQAAYPARNGSVGWTAVCVLRGFESQLAVWRLISERGLWFFPRFPVTDQAVYKRLHTAGTKPLERLFEQNVLAERVQGMVSNRLAPFAEEVVCIDESTLDTMSRRLLTMRDPEG